MELKGSKTEQNLMTAFAGESQARNKYTYFASKAKKDGYEQIAAIFEETAANEKEHAKMWFKELAGIGNTKENLAAAAEGENYEWTDMYEGFAKTAPTAILTKHLHLCRCGLLAIQHELLHQLYCLDVCLYTGINALWSVVLATFRMVVVHILLLSRRYTLLALRWSR